MQPYLYMCAANTIHLYAYCMYLYMYSPSSIKQHVYQGQKKLFISGQAKVGSEHYSIECMGNVVSLTGHILLITQSCLSVAQASSSFKCIDMCTPTHATPTFIAEALHLVTYVQLIVKVK